ncbi:MAG: trypsin-like peptidase domain-containing protein [Longicatena sp.]
MENLNEENLNEENLNEENNNEEIKPSNKEEQKESVILMGDNGYSEIIEKPTPQTDKNLDGSQDQEKHTETTNTSKRKKKRNFSFIKKHRNATLIAGCLLLSVGSGFGGTLLALSLNRTNTSGTVLYQSVTNTSSNKNGASATNMSVKEVANATMNSVVEIKTESVSTNSFFQQAVQSGAGSGVILSKDGYIVTNNHVINGANKVSVATKDGKKYDAKLIGSDAATDLAVIKIETTDLIPVVLGESSKLEVGDNAIAIGNPLGELGGTVTTGIISALDRAITIDNQTMHLLQTNAAINPGNSGGGLFNDQGQLIGIVNAKSGGENIEGLGFAIPIDRAKTIITNLIENGYVKDRASLGVTLTLGGSSNPFAQEKESQQVYIYKVSEGKAADKAGLKAGDQILKIDNEKVTTISNVTNVINAHKPGDSVKLSILRDSETKVVSVTLGVSEPTQTQQKEG